MKFKTPGPHQNFLFKIISGVQVNINMHISKFYLEDLEHAQDVELADFEPYYNLYYERIGSHPERIKNLFYAYTFLLHTIDVIKLNLPKYTYDNASNYENERMRNRMKWLGHYVSGLVDLNFTLGNEQQLKDLSDTIKPTFVNITQLME
jgi:ERO1-like protein alpha